MKKMKKWIILIVLILLFAMLHFYTEWKYPNNETPKGIIEQIDEWAGELWD